MADAVRAGSELSAPAGMTGRWRQGLPYFTFARLDRYASVVHGIFSREGGVSDPPYDSLNTGHRTDDSPAAVRENVNRVARALELDPAGIVRPTLSHGNTVAALEPAATPAGDALVDADAVIFDQPAISALMSPADCAVVMLFDPEHHAVGMVHAGWRGIVAKLVGRTLTAMEGAYGTRAESVQVGVGPSVGPCHYRIRDPAQKQMPAWHRYLSDLPDGRTAIDLRSALRDQILGLGIDDRNLTCDDRCTACHVGTFFSHHLERRTGRIATVIGLRAL